MARLEVLTVLVSAAILLLGLFREDIILALTGAILLLIGAALVVLCEQARPPRSQTRRTHEEPTA